MADFDVSPRETKRRRTGTYATRRTTLSSASPKTNPATRRSNRGTEVPEEIQDNLVEGQEEVETPPAEDVTTTGESAAELKATSQKTKSGTTETAGQTSGTVAATHGTPRTKRSRKSQNGDDVDVQLPEENEQDNHGEEQDTQPRSSGRTRRPPRRYLSPGGEPSDQVVSSEKKPSSKVQSKSSKSTTLRENGINEVQSPQPKGILTPSRSGRDKRTGPRKSVIFEQNEEGQTEKQIEEQLGFKDIGSSVKSGTRRQNKRKSQVPSNEQPNGQDELEESTTNTNGAGGDDEQDDVESLLDQTPDLDDILSLSQDLGVNGKSVDTCVSQPEDEHLTKIKAEVLNRVTNHDLSPISHLEAQYTTLHALLAATVTAGESNSLLLLGSRGSGKSLLVSHALADLTRSHGDDFHVVRLNGFFQTDDKLALREIWRQLGREMAVSEDETGEVSSYADTMASLLSLLSHPEEFADPDSMALDDNTDGTEHKTSKSIIFIIDEFDLFTTHPRQTLLYNLFDIAQARKAPIAVIGCSTRMDVVECLEKRVKSRFSHRWLHVPHAKSLVTFEEAVTRILSMPVEGNEALGVTQDDLEWRERWNQSIKTRFLPSPTVQDAIKKTFYTTKSIPDLLAELYIPIATLSVPSNDASSPLPPIETTSSLPPSLLTLLPHLPILHLSLLIAAARLETIYDAPTLNFTLAHKQYTDLLARAKLHRSSVASFTSRGGNITGTGLRSWSKDTARAAWEELAQWELIVPASGGAGGAGKLIVDDAPGGDGVATRMVRVDVTLDEVAWAVKEKFGAVGAVAETLGKWCTEV